MGHHDRAERPLTALAAALLAAFALPVAAGAANVRVPRDSPVLAGGRVVQPAGAERSRLTANPPWAPDQARRPAPPAPLGIDPGYRPLWIPDSFYWNGFRAVRVPGHWAW